jgi:hypothetical protein
MDDEPKACGNGQGERRPGAPGKQEGASTVPYYVLLFLLIGLIAGFIGLARVAVLARRIAWTLFLIGIGLA